MGQDYPEKKIRELTEDERREITTRIEEGDDNIYQLAEEIGCSTSQIAGIKAALNRGKKEK